LAACAAFVAITGCSFVAVRPTPMAGAETKKAECSSALWPVLDVAGAVVVGLAFVWLDAFGKALDECGKYPNSSQCSTHPQVYVPLVLYGTSAIYGFWAVAHCHSQLEKDENAVSLASLDSALKACNASPRRLHGTGGWVGTSENWHGAEKTLAIAATQGLRTDLPCLRPLEFFPGSRSPRAASGVTIPLEPGP
jgi:hypothetical protein